MEKLGRESNLNSPRINIVGVKLPFRPFAHRVSSPEERTHVQRIKETAKKPISWLLKTRMVSRLRSTRGKRVKQVRATLSQTETLSRAMQSHLLEHFPENPAAIGTLSAIGSDTFGHLVPMEKRGALTALRIEAERLRGEIREFFESRQPEPAPEAL